MLLKQLQNRVLKPRDVIAGWIFIEGDWPFDGKAPLRLTIFSPFGEKETHDLLAPAFDEETTLIGGAFLQGKDTNEVISLEGIPIVTQKKLRENIGLWMKQRPIGTNTISVGDTIYDPQSRQPRGEILDIRNAHEFPDGTITPAVLIRAENGAVVWTPRETLNKALVAP